MKLTKSKGLRGTLSVASDKSISHRAVILGSISQGVTKIENFLLSEDCLATISCFEKMGVKIEIEGNSVKIQGKGLHGLQEPKELLYTGNSGTTTRLLCGLLSAQNFFCCLDGDASIRKRPMDRVAKPLKMMGANITLSNHEQGDVTLKGNEKKQVVTPISIEPATLQSIEYTLPVASAQLKSALILAGLYAEGKTVIVEKVKSRDHTERMINGFGGNVVSKVVENKQISGGNLTKVYNNIITVNPIKELFATQVTVPGDISSAAFFIVAALIVPNSDILIKNVGLNPTRTGILDVLKEMGGEISIENQREDIEPVGDIRIKSSQLEGCKIGGDLIPRLIDEIPVIAVAAAFATGTTIIEDAQELKVKESNRIDVMATELKKAGVDIKPTPDGLIINGKINVEMESMINDKPIMGSEFETYDDHRIAMALSVLAIAAEGTSVICNHECVNISFPQFFQTLSELNL